MKRLSELITEIQAIHSACETAGVKISSNIIDEGDALFQVDFRNFQPDNTRNIWMKEAVVTYDNLNLFEDNEKFATLETVFQKYDLIPSYCDVSDSDGTITFDSRYREL